MKSSTELEILVARIQKQLAPKAEVLHNVKMDGIRSKRKRQVDVLVRQKIGQYPIQIVIECKDYAKKVDVKGVEEFAGLLADVGAQRGVLVCPKGFSTAAKTRAADLQMDLYSPIDTDPHKWQARPTMPALCDFRSAIIAFRLSSSSGGPFKTTMDFYNTLVMHDMDERPLGKAVDIAISKWNDGLLPTDIGEHLNLQIFDSPQVKMDNGYGTLIPVTVTIQIIVSRRIYFGNFPILRMSGFEDHLAKKVIANVFEFGMLDPAIVEDEWLQIEKEEDAPVKPAIILRGLIGWAQ